MGCACISDVNNKLAEHNAGLVTTLFAAPKRVVIGTNKVDSKKRGKPPYMLATFCPFCGEKYVKNDGEASISDIEGMA